MLLKYKESNKLDGFKITIMKFKEDLRRSIMFEIIMYYQRYPELLNKGDFRL